MTRRGWALDPGDAETVIAGARNALFVMVGVLAVIWIVQIVNAVDHYQLSQDYGIRPRDVADLPYIFTAPFLHFSWTHIEGNSGPLFIFGFLAAYRGIAKFAGVTAVVVVTSGLAAWFFESPHSVGAGASGVVFGYFGYIMVRGLFDRHAIDVLVGAVMALCFAYQFSVLLPHQGIGWQAHVGGVVGGVLSGWVFRDRRAAQARRAVSAAAGPGAKVAAAPGSGVAVRPASSGSLGTASRPAAPAGRTGKTGKGFAVDPANPRAELYKQLDDLGL
ncbi:MAG TPA: rhomboid family intramembrane serine protease [Streptosporangiaceae bacterium]|nr:rhomboid family intramembrane serine protease [Streptosporangiaceae bacterium]